MMHGSRRGFLGKAAAGLVGALLPSPGRAAENFDAFVADQMAAARIPGLALGLARDGAVSFTRAYGYADLRRHRPTTSDTMFHIASITKVITAQTVMLMVDEGKIALDDPIARHLDFAILGEGALAITFRHLLTHMSAFPMSIITRSTFGNAVSIRRWRSARCCATISPPEGVTRVGAT